MKNLKLIHTIVTRYGYSTFCAHVFFLVSLAMCVFSCGNSIENAKDFTPNKAPVICDDITAVMADGSAVNKTKLVTGQKIIITIHAYDPEGSALFYTINSANGSISDRTVTGEGIKFVLTTVDVSGGVNVILDITVTDNKSASASTRYDVGTGQLGAVITLAVSGKELINAAGSTDLTFTSNSTGYFQIFNDNVSETVTSMRPGGQYPFDAESDGSFKDKSLRVGGKSYQGSDAVLKLLSGGNNRIWVVFKDPNGAITSTSCFVNEDDVKPSFTSIPSDGATGVSANTRIVLSFNDNVDLASAVVSVKKSSSSVPNTIEYIENESTSSKAVYSVDGLEKSVGFDSKYIVSVSGVKDIAGNVIDNTSFSFVTAYRCAVTFFSNGGSPVSNQDLDENELVVRPTDPVLIHYSLEGWYKEASLTNRWNFNTDRITRDTSLFAKWKINTHTVTFDAQGGTSVSSQQIDYGSKVSEPDTPSKSGLIFRGWFTDKTTYSTAWNFANDVISENITLYARWGLQCTVSFAVIGKTGGTVPSPITYFYGEPVTLASYNVSTGNLIKQEAAKASRISSWTDGTQSYADGATVLLGSSDVTLTGVWNEYEVGDPGPAGGTIFYVNSAGYSETSCTVSINYVDTTFSFWWKYLEVSPTDLSGRWNIGNGAFNTVNDFGSGFENTMKLYAYISFYPTESIAAKTARSYTLCGYSNWFIPSYNEIITMYNGNTVGDVSATGNGIRDKLGSNYIWSSSEPIIYEYGVYQSSKYDAYIINPNTGFVSQTMKSNSWTFRVIRGF